MADLHEVILTLYNTNQETKNIQELKKKIQSLEDHIPAEVLLAINEIIFTIYQKL
jgi:hypothetical protein